MMIAMLMLIISLVLGIAAMWMHYRQRYELSIILDVRYRSDRNNPSSCGVCK